MAPVLIVDDDPDIRTLLRAVLEADGLTVVDAATGREALALLEPAHPRLVLLDVMLPGGDLDGYGVIQALRRQPGPFVPIILITGLDDPAVRARAIELGADEVLQKPIHPSELRLRVRAMLRIQHLAAELHLANRRLSLLASTDELTGLRNLRGLRTALARELTRAERYGRELSVIQLDVDRFKEVNDKYGHAVGDRVLQAVSRALEAGVRQVDVVARSGGEEFVVVAPETPMADALQVAERLRALVGAVVVAAGGDRVSVTISAGVASCRSATADAILATADEALYRAKAQGRNRVEAAARSAVSQVDGL